MGMTVYLSSFVVLFIFCVLAALAVTDLKWRKDANTRFGSVLLLFTVIAAAGVMIGVSAGHGYVSEATTPISKVLSNGREYSLVGVIHSGKSNILIIEDGKVFRDSGYHLCIVRTDDPIPPMHFTMVNGVVVATPTTVTNQRQ